MTYLIKYTDDHGDWFFMRRGLWCDVVGDARSFTNRAEAEHEADLARGRIAKRTPGVPGVAPAPRLKIIANKPVGVRS